MNLSQIHQVVVDHLESQSAFNDLSAERLQEIVLSLEARGELKFANTSERDQLIESLIDKILHWGALSAYLRDPDITEIMLNGTQSLFIEKQGRLFSVPNTFESADEVMQIIHKMVGLVGRRIDLSSPLVDARLPDGSRINAIIPPLSLMGPVLTIRRFSAVPLDLDELVRRGSLSADMSVFLKAVINARLNMVVSGGTGAGKTTLLNALASCVSSDHRLVTIEDSAEMRIIHPHLVALESRPANLEGEKEIPIRTLLKNALRMRPDRIIVGEIRGGEAIDMLQAMNTGHQGSLTTVHANSPFEAILRIETMCMMSQLEMPLSAVRTQIRQALHIIIQQERLSSGRRVISSICVMSPFSSGEFTISDNILVPLFAYDRSLQMFKSFDMPEFLKSQINSIL